MERYDSYKDSGVEWIGEIPKGWEVKRLKNVSDVKPSNVDKHIFPDEIQVRLCNYTDVYYNDFISESTELKSGSCNQMEFEKFRLEKGDVIITKDSESPDDIGIPCLIKDDFEDVVCGYHLTLIRPQTMDGGFIFRFIQSDRTRRYFEINSNGITRYGLGKYSIENLFLPIPPLSEQSQIVQFLDEKTSLIDSLIEKTKRKIELLKEERTSLINHTVTKGLNPNVEMKDSGVECIGDIPRGWVSSKLGFYTTKIGSGSTPRGGSEVYVDEGIPFIRSQNVHFDGLILDGVSFIELDTHDSMNGSKVVRDDILLNITGGSIGRCCVVNIEGEMNVNQHVSIIRTKPVLINVFLNYILRSDVGQLQVRFNMSGGNREGLTIEGISNFQITLPPFSEQEEIVHFLDEKTSTIDKTIELEGKRIDYLKEYRQSLISEVVTGKIKVVN